MCTVVIKRATGDLFMVARLVKSETTRSLSILSIPLNTPLDQHQLVERYTAVHIFWPALSDLEHVINSCRYWTIVCGVSG